MKKRILILLLCLPFTLLKAQQTNIQFYPPNPTETDTVMVVMDFSFQFVNCDYGIVTNGSYVFEDRIDFYPEFCPGWQDSTYCETSDTLYLTDLDAGIFDVSVYVGLTGQCPVGNNYTPLDTITTSLQVGIVDAIFELEASAVKIYPNPTNGDFNIEFESGTTYLLKVCNALGQVLFTDELNDQRNTVSLNSYPNGIYFLEFEGVNSERFVRKVEVRK